MAVALASQVGAELVDIGHVAQVHGVLRAGGVPLLGTQRRERQLVGVSGSGGEDGCGGGEAGECGEAVALHFGRTPRSLNSVSGSVVTTLSATAAEGMRVNPSSFALGVLGGG